MNKTLTVLFFSLLGSTSLSLASEKLLDSKRTILMLGDSITQAGDYVTYFDAWLVKKFPDKRFTIINAGVSSETISGLSEENHAGGKFPRPDLHERLERVLTKTQPDLIIACYGMNCGIYKESDDERTARFRDGNLRLRDAARKYKAEIVHVTPPIFDNQGKAAFDYDTVLSAYSAWMVKQREEGWNVVDLHSEMRAKVDQAKAIQPGFTVQKDNIHPDSAGHWMMAQSLIAYFGDPESSRLKSADELLDSERLVAISQRMKIYQKAIHAETNPLRPGVPQGGTLESAATEAKALEERIYGSAQVK
jgi:lysophospholipase L1-like esterase